MDSSLTQQGSSWPLSEMAMSSQPRLETYSFQNTTAGATSDQVQSPLQKLHDRITYIEKIASLAIKLRRQMKHDVVVLSAMIEKLPLDFQASSDDLDHILSRVQQLEATSEVATDKLCGNPEDQSKYTKWQEEIRGELAIEDYTEPQKMSYVYSRVDGRAQTFLDSRFDKGTGNWDFETVDEMFLDLMEAFGRPHLGVLCRTKLLNYRQANRDFLKWLSEFSRLAHHSGYPDEDKKSLLLRHISTETADLLSSVRGDWSEWKYDVMIAQLAAFADFQSNFRATGEDGCTVQGGFGGSGARTGANAGSVAVHHPGEHLVDLSVFAANDAAGEPRSPMSYPSPPAYSPRSPRYTPESPEYPPNSPISCDDQVLAEYGGIESDHDAEEQFLFPQPWEIRFPNGQLIPFSARGEALTVGAADLCVPGEKWSNIHSDGNVYLLTGRPRGSDSSEETLQGFSMPRSAVLGDSIDIDF